MTPLEPGQVLGDRFELLGALGRGGTATVWLARDRDSGEEVALKIVHPHLADEPSTRRRLAREVEVAGRLRHPAALLADELCELGGWLALRMPLHPGRSLLERVAADGPMSPDAARALGVRLAEALAEAHRRGVLHRDVSPANIMLDGADVGSLMDFGLARVQDGRAARSTALLGTAGYTAPEIYDGDRGDPRSDLYGLGAALYLAVTGRPPFEAPTPMGALQRQLEGAPQDIEPALPEDLRALIAALLDPDPERRPASAGSVVEALREARLPPSLPARGPSLPAVADPSPPARHHLPPGDWAVKVTWRLRAERQDEANRERLARAVALEAGLPADALEIAPGASRQTFVLVRGVERSAAERLAQAAQAGGCKTDLVPTTAKLEGNDRLLTLWWVPIPIAWVCFPFLVSMGLPPQLLLPFFIALSILLPSLASAFGWITEQNSPLAYGRDLRLHLKDSHRNQLGPLPEQIASAAIAPPPPIARPDSAAPARRGERLERKALEALDRLEAAIASLSGPARADMTTTVQATRAQARALGTAIDRLDASLAAPPVAGDTDAAWLEERLARLDTLERSGRPADPIERAEIERSLAASRARADDARDAEAQLTAHIARLLEIRAAAERACRRLSESGASAGPALATRLEREADAWAAAREEVGLAPTSAERLDALSAGGESDDARRRRARKAREIG